VVTIMTPPTTPESAASATTTDALAEYAIAVKTLMEEALRDKRSCSFGNRDIAHARVVISTMLNSADQEVLIYAREMNGEKFNPEAIKALLQQRPHVKFEVLVDDARSLSSPTSALSSLMDEIQSRKIKVFYRIGGSQAGDQHLCSVDKLHVRVEDMDGSSRATVNFGDGELGKKAARRFADLQKRSTQFIPT
jgi:hypothetical protein